MKLPELDRDNTVKRYTERYQKHGYSPETLGWKKGRQHIRFDILTSQYDFRNKKVFDIGCGFGDLNLTLERKFGKSYQYVGVDLVEDLVAEARKQYPMGHASFLCGDFLDLDLGKDFDYAIASGVFNHQLDSVENYTLIEASIARSLEICRDGLAFDFLSDKVDYRLDHTFHSSPEKILEIAYKYSRNVILRNDYMPFEFSLFIFKDDSFSVEDAVFNRFKSAQLS
jgi:SAM-dependent methyltransferase